MGKKGQDGITQDIYNRWTEFAKSLFKYKILSFRTFAIKMLAEFGNVVRPYLKELYFVDIERILYLGCGSWLTPHQVVEEFDISSVNEDIARLEEEIERLQGIIEERVSEAATFDDEIIDKVCKRAKRRINLEKSYLVEELGYPSKFTAFDIITLQHEGNGLAEMEEIGYAHSMRDYVEDVLDDEIDKLSPMEKSIFYGSEVDKNYECDISAISRKIYDAFIEMLNRHYSSSKKIEQYYERMNRWE